MSYSVQERSPSNSAWVGSRIGLGTLINFLRRAAIAHRAGVDLLKFWDKEAEAGPRDLRRAATVVQDRLRAGDSLTGAVAACRGYFPPLVVEMIEIGEMTGRLDDVLDRLRTHYEHLRDLRRSLIMGLIWPGIQLGMAICVVGLLIWVVGFIASLRGGEPIDILGIGLVGNRGLAIYIALVVSFAGAIAFGVMALRNGWLGTGPIKFCLKIPVIGNCLKKYALARFSWTLALTLESGVDARRSLRLALRATQLPTAIAAIDRADEVIVRGGEFHEACRDIDGFSDDFVTSLAAAEQAQSISESLHYLSNQYREQAELANKVLTTFASFAIWGGVAAMIILLIFRLFMFYMGVLNEALDGVGS